ncbi:hypothetical protein J1N35_003761 [Gossypium stocksii]|uniref:Retrotransposon Copia-like N-terminal domain-containing protein n=1 Tax=Gossypium stocksii TaxID=47602 RepID=A0A9D3WB21_9ROSI|nr:hypothetical protein J1N35_003761 [Gossypium stocksii]
MYHYLSMVSEFPNHFAIASQKVAILVDDSNFLAWKRHVLLVIKTHRLQSFIDGTVTMPPRIIVDNDGVSLDNPTYI